ncbi:MAG TPA: GspE/PulE family protein [Candidatus Moranbacteria bacterium]|nr:GspE/PulE family protein [Candidatus Moranbacteria bacterium]
MDNTNKTQGTSDGINLGADDKVSSEIGKNLSGSKSGTFSVSPKKPDADEKKDIENKTSEIAERAGRIGIAYIEKMTNRNIESGVINLISPEVAKKYKMAAFERNGKVVKIAMVDPQNTDALNALRFIAEREKVEIEAYLVAEDLFEEIMESYTGPGEIVKQAVESFKEDVVYDGDDEKKKKEEDEKKREILKDAPVAKLVEVVVSHAIEGKASDIHIEPMDKNYRVRFRVDGILHVSLVFPEEIGPAIISRIKILANLKIDEKRKPQDGRFRLTLNKKEMDFRVSTLPVIDGEKVVMRILDKAEGLVNIQALGLMGSNNDNMMKALEETYGMILMTGPTGSGKSTTLYSLLKVLNVEERNIITLEDPIEYNIEGLNQSQIKPEIGYTFASGLRTILRQDPNVIMVGEIRDSETAELAVHAALTGHLMFSTLHTNTAIGAIPRLIDMGIEPFLLSSSLRIVAAQRLVRRICEKCKEKIDIPQSVKNKIKRELTNVSDAELKKYDIDLSKEINFYRGKGCDFCNGTGLKGRMAVFEAVPVNENIKNIIVEKRGSEELINKERQSMGLITMKQDGILKIIKGFTTIEEIERVTEGSIALAEEND